MYCIHFFTTNSCSDRISSVKSKFIWVSSTFRTNRWMYKKFFDWNKDWNLQHIKCSSFCIDFFWSISKNGKEGLKKRAKNRGWNNHNYHPVWHRWVRLIKNLPTHQMHYGQIWIMLFRKFFFSTLLGSPCPPGPS